MRLRSLCAQEDRDGLAGAARFVGSLDRDSDLLDCHAIADILSFALRTETRGLVLLEAMAIAFESGA